MSIRLDPRRLAALKLMASDAGMRPGELVTRWIEERIDAARAGTPEAAPATQGTIATQGAFTELSARVDAIAQRVEELAASMSAAAQPAPAERATATGEAAATPATPRRRGRPRTRPVAAAKGTGPRIALHDEIIEIIRERGPQTAAELAAAVAERGRYAPPRSAKPVDASVINSRVSNPVYRHRFTRREGRIDLSGAE